MILTNPQAHALDLLASAAACEDRPAAFNADVPANTWNRLKGAGLVKSVIKDNRTGWYMTEAGASALAAHKQGLSTKAYARAQRATRDENAALELAGG